MHEQACLDMFYDQRGNADPERIEQMLHEVDMGLWDNYLFGNYEMYKNAKAQISMSNIIQAMAQQQSTTQIENNK
jgi:hypothetical protein